ncbi:MAG TPA: FAD-binding oxidoreductase [Candidatus Limnocylindrales bacterium]|nr:FAD-binding oxidoreductase [Candidatus Limnocylindrales bacterium]
MTFDPVPLLDALRAAVGSDHVLTDADLRASYETDWSRRWHGDALAVVRPASADQVAAVVRACAAAGVAIIPQGGNTGLVGGSVPRSHAARPQVIVSTLRLRDVEPVDLLAGEVTVGAGATLGALQAHVRPAGFGFGVDLGARDSATVGGMVATNAGGIHVLRYGPMRMQLVGIEAVLADGSIVRRLPGMLKDNTGYHLPSLLAGSEGTLAIITRVRLRLVPLLPRRAVALLALDDTATAVTLAGALRSSLPSLAAAELFFDEGLALVLRRGGGERPFREEHPAYLLLEVESRVDPTDDLAAAIDAAGDVVRHAVLASDGPGRERLWHLREGHTEAINAEGVPHKLDVALPLDRLAEFVDRVRAAVEEAAPGAACYLYGHVCDGNLHIGVIGPPAEDEAVDAAILRLTIEMGGTISAEHGVGVAKVDWLEADRGTADVAAMRAIKRALDPGRILNPGVIFRD